MTTQAGQIELRTVQHTGFREIYLTGTPPRSGTPAPATAASRDLLGRVAELLGRERVQLITEKLYGTTAARDDVLAARRSAFAAHGLDASLPLTYLEHALLDEQSCPFAGVQIWGVVPDDERRTLVTTVGDDRARARRAELGTTRLLYLPAVTGRSADGLPTDPETQGRNMFANASAALAAHGVTYTRVFRTWIYVARLLDWYDGLNRVRHVHHAAEGVGERDGSVVPASTGIQGGHQGTECVMDVLAVDGRGSAVICPIMSTTRQNAASTYGSAFSRGMMLETEEHRTIYVSGTASIDTTGASVHLGDADAQCEETLLSVASVLEQRGATLANVCQATLFCKTAEVAEAYARTAARLGVPTFPTVQVRADVCRPELLVEMEAVAVV